MMTSGRSIRRVSAAAPNRKPTAAGVSLDRASPFSRRRVASRTRRGVDCRRFGTEGPEAPGSARCSWGVAKW